MARAQGARPIAAHAGYYAKGTNSAWDQISRRFQRSTTWRFPSPPGNGRDRLEKSRIEVRRATGSILEEYGISIANAKRGVVEATIASKSERIRVLSPTINHISSRPWNYCLSRKACRGLRALAAVGAGSPRAKRLRCAAHRSQLHARHHFGQGGLDLLARLQEIDPRLPVIVMTAWETSIWPSKRSSEERAISAEAMGK